MQSNESLQRNIARQVCNTKLPDRCYTSLHVSAIQVCTWVLCKVAYEGLLRKSSYVRFIVQYCFPKIACVDLERKVPDTNLCVRS